MDTIAEKLVAYASLYEDESFLQDDPSLFMHKVDGTANQEVMAFIASCLSYGSRKQFFPKIQYILDKSGGDVYNWVLEDRFNVDIPDNDACYYRLYSNHTMNGLLSALQYMLDEYETIGNFVKSNAHDGFSAVSAFTSFFSVRGIETIIPKDTSSACKRICMFLRWMVRDNSPVDLGLWSDFIDKRTLIIPLDTHVLQEANTLGLLNGKTASMTVAKKLTAKLSLIFPDDPLKGDFALFGYGVNK